MSCGNPHATPCTEVLAFVYVYIDGEIDEEHRVTVAAHLTECPPCEGQYAVERRVRALVQRCCQGETAPPAVRERIVASIRQVTITTVEEGR